MTLKRSIVRGTAYAIGLAALSTAALAEDETGTERLPSALAELEAKAGITAADKKLRKNADGTTSAVPGLSHVKLLVIRENADGTFSTAHVSSDEEAKAFAESTVDPSKPAEE
jgi:hypothetical protein